jgi:hypothetical protein
MIQDYEGRPSTDLGDRLRLLIVSNFRSSSSAIKTIMKYVRIGNSLGHKVALFSDPIPDMRDIPTSRNIKEFDYVMFIVYKPSDFPRLPYLAHLLDNVPREQRIVVDCAARYSEAIHVEDDSNDLEHSSWEWVDGFSALAKAVLQPTRSPLLSHAQAFLFHGFDPDGVERRYDMAAEAAKRWMAKGSNPKKYGVIIVGHDTQCWSQIRSLLQDIESSTPSRLTRWWRSPIRQSVGPIYLPGCPQEHRAMFEMFTRWKFKFSKKIPSDEARFFVVMNRPLFNSLGIVTNQMFETFCSDTIPLLMMPRQMVDSIYGSAARPLAVGDNIADHIQDVIRRPIFYWEAVLKTRAYLADHHSFQKRFQELSAILQQ